VFFPATDIQQRSLIWLRTGPFERPKYTLLASRGGGGGDCLYSGCKRISAVRAWTHLTAPQEIIPETSLSSICSCAIGGEEGASHMFGEFVQTTESYQPHSLPGSRILAAKNWIGPNLPVRSMYV
jgi:hypothetical protein